MQKSFCNDHLLLQACITQPMSLGTLGCSIPASKSGPCLSSLINISPPFTHIFCSLFSLCKEDWKFSLCELFNVWQKEGDQRIQLLGRSGPEWITEEILCSVISSERALCSLALSYVGLEWERSCEYGAHTKLPLSGNRRFCIQPHWIQAL